MSDNGNGTSIITKPSGGGAIGGMGEKFSPDLFTGTGNFSVPIALPPGRNGFQPDITLVYSSGNGSSVFGLGWNLSIPGVSRKTSKGIPLYDDDKDVFILSGAEDLIEVKRESLAGGGYKATFQPRTEGLFARIERYKTKTNDYWKVWSKDGLISYYGTPEQANTFDQYNDPAVLADPAYRSKVFQWYLTKTQDVFGNTIEYSYTRENRAVSAKEDDPHDYDMLYLSSIRYSGYGGDKFFCSVSFLYETRSDPFSVYKQGFELRTTKRAKAIELYTHPEVETVTQNILSKRYHFVYLDQRVEAKELPASLLPFNGMSMLSQVKIEGVDGSTSEWMPPLEFGYSDFQPEHRNFDPVNGPDMPSESLSSRDYEMADLFGNGLPDIVQLNGVARYWRNLGDGTFDLPRFMKEVPSGAKLADPQIQLIDADGDGRLDLLYNKPGVNGYYSMKPDVLWDPSFFKKHKYTPSFSLSDPEVKLLDLDGDGITDALRNGSRLECFLNDPVEGFYKTITVEKSKIKNFPNISFTDPRIRFADMCGDGLQDIVQIQDGSVCYWPNLGYGRFGAMVRMKKSPRFPYRYDPALIQLGDVDGDGCADLVYVENNQVTLWVNRCGESWSEPVVIKGTPPVTDPKAIRFTDVKGTGIAGLLWSYNYLVNPGRNRMYLLDFTQGVKPYVLNKMDNHMGAVTRVEYKPSTWYYLKDQQRRQDGTWPGNELGVLPNGKRTTWKTTLPFPVQVVSRVEVIDELSQGKLVTEYSYHHGYWDGGEREFRGFGRVHQRDTESFQRFNESTSDQKFNKVENVYYTPPTETISWFHLGPIGAERGDWKEVYFEDEYWSLDPQVLKRPAEMIGMINALPRRARRDAYRTLRGSSLRTELYALDGNINEKKPYTISENLQGVRLEYPLNTQYSGLNTSYGPDENNKQGSGYIFFSHALSSRSTQWERGNDPMTSFSFSEHYNEYGSPLTSISIAVPRGKDPLTGKGSAEAYLATASTSEVVHKKDGTHYLINRPVSAKAYEVENAGNLSVFALKNQVLSNIDSGSFSMLNRLSHSLTYYDGAAHVGLPYGSLGDYGVAVRSEVLMMTEDQLDDIYGEDNRPFYIKTISVPIDEDPGAANYPEGFLNGLNPGYFYYNGMDSIHEAGYYTIASRMKYDFQDEPEAAKGLMLETLDPLGNATTVEYDDYQLLPVKVTDNLGMETNAVYDYRIMQAYEIKDPNGNRAQFAFSPLGFLNKTYALGKNTESIGDTDPEKPGTLMEYDFFAFANEGKPVYVKTTVREHHASEAINDDTIVSVQYSDGFGRLLQTRSQAEETIFGNSVFGDSGLDPVGSSDVDATGLFNTDEENPNVIVSGWQVYNNKGKVVEKYEPYYDKGFDYMPPLLYKASLSGIGEAHAQRTATEAFTLSQRIRMFYDPRGQVIRTVNPDGTEQRIIFGVPRSLDSPLDIAPTPWEQYSYDANDLKPLTHPTDTSVPEAHEYTPSSTLIDAMGRTVATIDRNYKNGAIEEIKMQYEFDIRGNLLTVTDPRGRTVFIHAYDWANRPLRTGHIDGGIKYTILDCMNKPIELRDDKGAVLLTIYDEINRPFKIWARDNSEEAITLRQYMRYGDSSGLTDPEADNLKGKLYQHYDEAGLTTIEAYDFKGQVPEKTRRVIKDDELLSVFAGPPLDWQVQAYRVDWDTSDDTILDAKEYVTSMQYDAIGRVTKMTYPEDVDSERKILLPSYNRSGALESVQLKDTVLSIPVTYVDRIAYNARGQKIFSAFGNGTMTRYLYRNDNFRLLRMKSEGYEKTLYSGTVTYQKQSGTTKQNFSYEYDLSGNIVSITDKTTGCGVSGANELVRAFEYDALYRLLKATGRETANVGATPWNDTYRPANPTHSRAYTQHYDYDKLGNIQELQHVASGGNFTRTFNYEDPATNKLSSIDIGANNYSFGYDICGNMQSEDTNRHFVYDYADRLKAFYLQASTEEPSQYTQYFYDAGGTRVKKISRAQGGGSTKTTVYIDGIFEHTLSNTSEVIPDLEIGTWTIGYGSGEQNTLHIMDGSSRIATRRIGEDPDDTTPKIKYNLEDHLGSSNLELSTDGALVSREECYPFGETSFGSYGKKRYRFCGKEKDQESGLYYYGLRYYNAWTCRFINIDPLAAKYPFYTPYQYAGNKPINFIDLDGAEPDGGTTQGGGSNNIQHGVNGSNVPLPENGKEGDTFNHNGQNYEYFKEGGWIRSEPETVITGIRTSDSPRIGGVLGGGSGDFYLKEFWEDITKWADQDAPESMKYSARALSGNSGVTTNLHVILAQAKYFAEPQRLGGVPIKHPVFDIKSPAKIKTFTNPNVSTNLQHVNERNIGTRGGEVNCANVVEATNATLKGNPASALSAAKGLSVKDFEKAFDGKFIKDLSLDQVKKQVPNPGTQGYVFGYKGHDKAGHYFNVKNEGGTIRFYDAQPSGEVSTYNPTGFINYWFMPDK